MKTPTDEELVKYIQDGNVLAYEELVKRYQRGLYVFVMRFLHDEAASSDVVQSSLVKIYEVIDRVDLRKKFSTFVFEIAKNAAISELRRRHANVSLEDIVDLEEEESFVEELYRTDLSRAIRKSVRSLPLKYKKVISLYYFEDLSYEEIGKRIHLPVNTVRTHLKRAKEKLKKLLQPYEND